MPINLHFWREAAYKKQSYYCMAAVCFLLICIIVLLSYKRHLLIKKTFQLEKAIATLRIDIVHIKKSMESTDIKSDYLELNEFLKRIKPLSISQQHLLLFLTKLPKLLPQQIQLQSIAFNQKTLTLSGYASQQDATNLLSNLSQDASLIKTKLIHLKKDGVEIDGERNKFITSSQIK